MSDMKINNDNNVNCYIIIELNMSLKLYASSIYKISITEADVWIYEKNCLNVKRADWYYMQERKRGKMSMKGKRKDITSRR